jgi:methionine synthase II (cobalamin-independent)
MFATLLGPLPWPDAAAPGDLDGAVDAAVRLQVEAGLAVATDGGLGGPDPVGAWRRTSALCGADAVAKAVVPGPWSLAGLDALQVVGPILETIAALAAAGCQIVEIAEPRAAGVGADPAARRAYREAHDRLVAAAAAVAPGVHLSLSVAGTAGPALAAGVEAVLDAPYASLGVDLIAAPDDWGLVVAAPASRGIVAGVIGTSPEADEGPEVPVWGAGYAASTNGRGPDRVGLAIGHGLEVLPWPVAARKVRALGAAARIAAMPAGEAKARTLDPRAVSSRSAAAGRYVPRGRRG